MCIYEITKITKINSEIKRKLLDNSQTMKT